MRVHPVVAVARDDDVARDIDIVDEARLREGDVLAGQVIDVQPRLLVGRDDQRAVGVGGIDPDRRIVGGVGTVGAHGLRLAARGDLHGRQAADHRGARCAAGERGRKNERGQKLPVAGRGHDDSPCFPTADTRCARPRSSKVPPRQSHNISVT